MWEGEKALKKKSETGRKRITILGVFGPVLNIVACWHVLMHASFLLGSSSCPFLPDPCFG